MPIAALLDRNGAERCATLRAPRLAPLLHRAPWAQMSPGLSPSLDETRGSGQALECRGSQFSCPCVKRLIMLWCTLYDRAMAAVLARARVGECLACHRAQPE